MSRLLKTGLFALGMLWTLPLSVVGLIAGLAALAFGANVRRSDAALVFHRVPFGPGGALALGNVILHTGNSLDETALTYACRAHGGNDCVRLGDHERAHVYQYMALGPLFLPLYFICGGISHRNRFEQAADRYALSGKGWWPWP
jgi:Ca2+/Na+ antiporter